MCAGLSASSSNALVVPIYDKIPLSDLFEATVQKTSELACEKLFGARIRNFPVIDAIDALTLGTINFLPKRIAEVTTSFTPASEKQRQQILSHLQQILTARVPKNGIVTLSVDEEFEVKLGIVNDNPPSPWHIYQTKLFLRDTEEPDKI
ncbi:unnamed protein product [Rotaria sordida]|uniref:Mediator of RNA polymerase II transcription subunit 14 n=1 Tax=Rotaria sordida TaxID=392033 RepID=A0A816E4E2_9BILA|nr:unnamed protein product [Rotaria sordida]CAF1641993.1 unnamed protein product [Rotaria sordida]